LADFLLRLVHFLLEEFDDDESQYCDLSLPKLADSAEDSQEDSLLEQGELLGEQWHFFLGEEERERLRLFLLFDLLE
jgi:hypothetical protein